MDKLEPVDEADLARAVAAANGPLRIAGGGTRMPVPGQGRRLSTTGLTGITLYEPGALTLIARAGTPLSEVEAALAAENQRLPFEPMDHRTALGTDGTPTIGGVVATNASGPRRLVAGACRDCLIGVRLVDGTGAIVKSGGRVMKNVTGYDLVKLMAGSHGTLGVLSEVAFKVLPATAAAATVTLRGQDPAAATTAMARAMGSPFEITGAAYVPGADPATHLRLEGFENSVAYRIDRVRELLSDMGEAEVETDPDAVADHWAGLRDGRAFAGGDDDLWRVSVRPSDGKRVLEAAPSARATLDWAGGLAWIACAPGTDLRAALTGIPGHATLVRASPETRARLGTFAPEPAPLAAIARGLRARFDPRGILNPGLMDAPETRQEPA